MHPKRRASLHRRIDQRADLVLILQPAVWDQLHHVADGEAFLGIDPVGRMIRPAPAVFAQRSWLPRLAEVGEDPEAEAKAHAWLERREHQIVRRHQLDALAREIALAVQLAASPQHFEEARIVLRRREQSGAAGERNARPAGIVPLSNMAGALQRAWAGRSLDLPILGRVDHGEPRRLFLGQAEGRIDHPERLDQPRAQELVQRQARYLLHHHAENVGVVAIDPLLARLLRHRQLGHALHHFRHRFALVGEIPAIDARVAPRTFCRSRAIRNARRMREQVADGDRPPRRHDVVPAADPRRRNRRALPLRQELAERIVQHELAFLHQHHDGDAGQRFRLGSNPEDGVFPHRIARFLVPEAVRFREHVAAVLLDHHHRAGDLLVGDIGLHRRIELLQPFLRDAVLGPAQRRFGLGRRRWRRRGRQGGAAGQRRRARARQQARKQHLPQLRHRRLPLDLLCRTMVRPAPRVKTPAAHGHAWKRPLQCLSRGLFRAN